MAGHTIIAHIGTAFQKQSKNRAASLRLCSDYIFSIFVNLYQLRLCRAKINKDVNKLTGNIYEDLDTLIRARYPIIYVESFEENRAINIVKSIIGTDNDQDENGKRLYIWSGTTGLTDPSGNQVKEGTEDPLIAMETIDESDIPMIVIFKDLHRYIDDIMVYRKLRDLHQNLKTTHKTIIIISPVLNIPLELQKVITVVSLPLPSTDELNSVMESVISAAEDNAQENNLTDQIEIFNLIREELKTSRDTILNAGLGLTLDEFENVIARSIVQHKQVKLNTIIAEKEQIIRKSGILEFFTSQDDMTEVGGLEILKEWIQKRKLAFSKEAAEFGLKPPKGVFLCGPPGTGKSLAAKTTSKFMQMPLLKLDVSRIYGSLVGQSEQNIAQALKTAEAVAPSILWLDEIEKALAGSQSSGTTDSGVSARVLGSFLQWLQDHKSPVFVIATSNNPTAIPPEFIRAGRFDQVFMVDLPQKSEREDIFKIHINKTGRDADIYSLEKFAELTDGFSGAEIESIIHDAMYDSYFGMHELNEESIFTSITNTIPLSKKRKEEIAELRKWGKSNAINASRQETMENNNATRTIEIM